MLVFQTQIKRNPIVSIWK